MPTYEYECNDCKRITEVFHGIFEQPSVVCEHCKSRSLIKLIGAGTGVVFKGKGFYRTDSRRQMRSNTQNSGQKDSTCTCRTEKGSCAQKSSTSPGD